MNANDLTGLGAVADLAGELVKRFFPDKSEEERARLTFALTQLKGQLDANTAQAANPRLFVAGARAFIMWGCGAAFLFNGIAIPLLGGFGVHVTPMDLSKMWPLLASLLGVA